MIWYVHNNKSEISAPTNLLQTQNLIQQSTRTGKSVVVIRGFDGLTMTAYTLLTMNIIMWFVIFNNKQSRFIAFVNHRDFDIQNLTRQSLIFDHFISNVMQITQWLWIDSVQLQHTLFATFFALHCHRKLLSLSSVAYDDEFFNALNVETIFIDVSHVLAMTFSSRRHTIIVLSYGCEVNLRRWRMWINTWLGWWR